MNHEMGTNDFIRNVYPNIGKRQLIAEGILDHPMWWYQSTFYSGLYDAKAYMFVWLHTILVFGSSRQSTNVAFRDAYNAGSAQEDVVALAKNFSKQGGAFLKAKRIEAAFTGAWDADYMEVMNHLYAL